MDAIDRKMLDILRAEARISINELAQRLDLSRASTYARFNRLQRDHVILGFTTRVAPTALGLNVAAHVHVRIKQNSWQSFRAKVWQMAAAEQVTLVAGDFDCVLLIRARDTNHLREIVLEQVQALPEVIGTQTVLIFEGHT